MLATKGDVKLVENIKRIMAERGLTQAEVARRMDVPKSAIYAIVHQKNGTTLYTLRRMREVLECTWDELLE